MIKDIKFGSGYKGYSWYGNSTDRESTNYKPTMSPRKVKFLVEKSITKDVGLQESINGLSKDGNNISEAIKGINNITREFLGIANNRGTEISKQNPKGARIPFVGLIAVFFRDDFNDRIKKELNEVKEDWDGIKIHYKTQVENINKHFLESCDEVSRQSKKGMPLSQNTYKNSSQLLHGGINNSLNTVSKELIKPTDEIMKTFVSKIYEAQQNKQDGSALRKGLLDLLHVVPVVGTIGAEFGKAALDALGDVVTDIAHGNFADIVQDSLSNFDRINIHDVLHGHTSDILRDGIHDLSIDSFTQSINESLFDGGIFNINHVDNVFQNFIEAHPDKCISNIQDFKYSLNWPHGKELLGKSVFMSSFLGVTDSLEKRIRTGQPFSSKDFAKSFMTNMLISPLSMFAEEATGFYEDLKIKGIPIGKRIENFVKPIGDSPLTPEMLKQKTDAIVDLLPKQTYNFVQENTSKAAGKLLTGRPLGSKDFEKLFESMEEVLRATNKALTRR